MRPDSLPPANLRQHWHAMRGELLLAVVLLLLIAGFTEWQWSQQLAVNQEAVRQQVMRELSDRRARLETAMNADLFVAQGLVAYTKALDGRVDEQEIRGILAELFASGQNLRNIGVAPDNRLRFIYPLKGNEKAIGLYYPAVPAQWKSIERAIREHKTIMAGPLSLVQGGRGLISRTPIFLADGRYWGIVSLVIDADKVLQHLRGEPATTFNRYALENPETGQWIDGDANLLQTEHLSLDIRIPGDRWTLSAAPRAGWHAYDPSPIWRVLGWGCALTLAIGSFLLLRQRRWRQATKAALKLSAQQLEKAEAIAHLGFWSLAERQATFVWSSEAAALCDWPENLAPPSFDQWLVRVDETDRPAVQRAFEQLFAGEPSVRLDFRLHLDAHLRWIRLIGETGAQAGVYGTWQDIAHEKELERLQREFISAVSHELRTPLTAIRGGVDLISRQLQKQAPSPKLQSLLDIVSNNAERLLALINDLLDMERLNSGRLTLVQRPEALVPLIMGAVADTTPFAEHHAVRFALNISEQNAWAHVDRMRFVQVLVNLLSNAAKFSHSPHEARNKESPKLVKVSLTAHGQHWRITVKDEGPGIPEAFRGRIFQRFSQADGSDTRATGGSGIGLHLSQALVQGMGGTIGFDTETGVGTTFYCDFPMWFQTASNS